MLHCGLTQKGGNESVMNNLIVQTASHTAQEDLLRRMRQTYPAAFRKNGGKEMFYLQEYLIQYCMPIRGGGEDEEYDDSWEEQFTYYYSIFQPYVRASIRDSITFFDFPDEVQRGILIWLLHDYKDGFNSEKDIMQIVSELPWIASEIHIEHFKRSEDFLSMPSDQKEDAIEAEDDNYYQVFNDYNSWYSSSVPFLENAAESIFLLQLLAYMGISIDLGAHPEEVADEDTHMFIQRQIIECMADEGGCKRLVFLGYESEPDFEFDDLGIVIWINHSQSLLNEQSDFSKYVSDLINKPFYREELHELMEKFPEFFPLRRQYIPVGTYARLA